MDIIEINTTPWCAENRSSQPGHFKCNRSSLCDVSYYFQAHVNANVNEQCTSPTLMPMYCVPDSVRVHASSRGAGGYGSVHSRFGNLPERYGASSWEQLLSVGHWKFTYWREHNHSSLVTAQSLSLSRKRD